MNTSNIYHRNWKTQLMCTWSLKICGEYSTTCFVYGFVFQVISEKHCVLNFYKKFERDFPMAKIVTIIPANLVANLLLSLFCNQKQESKFQQIGGLVIRNNVGFCL